MGRYGKYFWLWLGVELGALVCGAAAERELTVVSFHEDLLPGVRAVLPEFARRTGVRVQAQAVPHESYEMWIRTQMLGKNPPDVVLIDDANLAWRYGRSGLLQTLDAALAAPNAFDPAAGNRSWLASFKSELVQQGRDPAGRLWLVPFTQFGVGFFYNKNTYDHLGLKPPATWTELVENFKAVRASGATAFACGVRSNDGQTIWMADMLLELLLRPSVSEINLLSAPGWKYDPLDPACTREEVITLDERLVAFEHGLIDPARAPAFRETARLMKTLSKEFRPDFLSLDGEEVPRIFARGESVHFLNGTWYLRSLSVMQRSIGETEPGRVFSWGVFPFPELTAESTSLPLLGGINQNAGLRVFLLLPAHKNDPEREKAALQLAQFLTAPTVATTLFERTQVYDLPAMAGVPLKPGVEPLAPRQRFAFLLTAQFRGYDARGEGEFWTLWQRFLGDKIDLDEFLRELSASHRAALGRLMEEQAGVLNREFLKAQLPGGFSS